jgi:hypothetical protein
MKSKRKTNGRRAVNDHKSTIKARSRLLRRAKKQGMITNKEARQIMGRPQVWYHLNLLAEAGVLKRTAYNEWTPIRRRGRPMAV